MILHACSHPFPSLLPQAFHGKQHHRNILSLSNENQTISRVCLGFGERTLVSQVDRWSHFPGEEIFLGAQFWTGVFRWQTKAVLNRCYSNWVRSQTMVELFTDMILNSGMSSSHCIFFIDQAPFCMTVHDQGIFSICVSATWESFLMQKKKNVSLVVISGCSIRNPDIPYCL